MTSKRPAQYSTEEKGILIRFHRLFDNEDGRWLLDWLSGECMEHQSTFVPTNDRASAFNEGKRSLILRLRSILKESIQ